MKSGKLIAQWQLEGVKKMIEDGRYCVEILQQLKAARSATKSVELSILKRHMQMCLTKAVKDQEIDQTVS